MREISKEQQAAIDEYFAKGGTVTVCPKGERSDPNVIGLGQWGRKKKKPAKKEVDGSA